MHLTVPFILATYNTLRARSKPLDSQISGASQRTGIKQNPQPGKDAER